jgi:hypothetical protein
MVGFRSRRSRGIQGCIERMHEAQDGPHHMAKKWSYMVGPLLHLVASPIDFFLSRSSISKKMMWKKYWVHLTVGRSLKVKNMQKQSNLLRSAKTK